MASDKSERAAHAGGAPPFSCAGDAHFLRAGLVPGVGSARLPFVMRPRSRLLSIVRDAGEHHQQEREPNRSLFPLPSSHANEMMLGVVSFRATPIGPRQVFLCPDGGGPSAKKARVSSRTGAPWPASSTLLASLVMDGRPRYESRHSFARERCCKLLASFSCVAASCSGGRRVTNGNCFSNAIQRQVERRTDEEAAAQGEKRRRC